MGALVAADFTVVAVVSTEAVAALTEAALEGEVPLHHGLEAALIEAALHLPVPAPNRTQDPGTFTVPDREAIPGTPLSVARPLQVQVPSRAQMVNGILLLVPQRAVVPRTQEAGCTFLAGADPLARER